MNMRNVLDLSSYLVIGPENTLGRPVRKIVSEAVRGGFSCIQLRSKTASAKEMIQLTQEAAEEISLLKKSAKVSLLVNDRLDVALAAREQGIKVDGIHVGQTDIPVPVCRKYLGEDAIVGLSARTEQLINYVKSCDISDIDYFGVSPLHETLTKLDCGRNHDGNVIERSLDELCELSRYSKIPVVIGGGVKILDLPALAQTGVDGFFVVTAITEAENPYQAAKEMSNLWKNLVLKRGTAKK